MFAYNRVSSKSTKTPWIMATAVKTSTRANVPGLSVSDLSAFLGFGDFFSPIEQAMLQSFLDASIEMLSKYTGYEPSDINYTIKYDRHPMALDYTGGISGSGEYSEWINIPRRPVKSVNEIRISDDVITDYETDTESNPARVGLISYSSSYNYPSFSEIEIDITCGPTGDVNPAFIVAALLLASYIYNNRGCAMNNAISDSGAAAMIRPLKVAIGGL